MYNEDEAINEGVAYLNTKLDPNWPHQVNLSTLDLKDSNYCMIGQLIKNAGEHAEENNLCYDDYKAMGFAADFSDYNEERQEDHELTWDEFYDNQYEKLTEKWREKVKLLM
jgi:hypothetical protein